MAATITIIKSLALAFVLIILLQNSHGVSSTTTEATISASPGVLPSPDISSFFPTPMSSFEAPFEAEAPAPAPSSGEFHGNKSSSSTRLEYCVAAFIVGVMFSSFFLSIA
ncbi:unnamed protein product [Lathyrus sativus]|nr:unnamed protein product [Lathyrus sativus]